ncbi:conserved protein of unknown function (plasmid) [Rhodovastum atsumiense]|uniref:Uncharacterized protein n=1 Tax=Rhodovastum atsumiense TaxID=504468 RepID=A0A5M6IUD7_9PROT|nr:hypothetical protein [Rhodovastum atsumiense]KAA5611851.1 hypothetical protein F1189_12520 [Rhodovastum atsumiense]CAH2606173.1 conserved protein of unknown function [Rhodovastum atsumiense]
MLSIHSPDLLAALAAEMAPLGGYVASDTDMLSVAVGGTYAALAPDAIQPMARGVQVTLWLESFGGHLRSDLRRLHVRGGHPEDVARAIVGTITDALPKQDAA